MILVSVSQVLKYIGGDTFPPPTNGSRKFSNFSWIFYPRFLTNLRLGFLKIENYFFLTFFLSFSTMGVKISKPHSSYKSQPKFSSQWSSQNCVWHFWNFEFLFFNDFFPENFKFTTVAYREEKTLNYLENDWSRLVNLTYLGYLWSGSFQGHFQVIRCTFNFP